MPEQKKISIAGTAPGEHIKTIELTITTTTVTNSTFSAYTAFGETYDAAPRVIGTNCSDPQGLVNGAPTATGVTIYVYGITTSALPDGTVAARVTLHGRLA